MERRNEMRTSVDTNMPFDPIVVVRDVLSHWLTIILVALAVGVGAYILTDMEYAPRYQSKATFVVTSRSSSATVYNNLSSTTELAAVFSELINSSVMRKNIQEAMGTNFQATISASEVPQTNLLNMTVTASDPRTAFLVAQAIIDHHEAVTYQVVDGVSLEVLQSAQVPLVPSNRADATIRMNKMMLLAAMGTTAAIAWISLTRDRVRSGAEVRKKLDCDYLGEIPHEQKYKTLLSRIRRRKSGILVNKPVTSFRYVESLRKLVRRVERQMGSKKVLMVTSLLENEGKSTLAVNMALAMAQKKKRVLLVDCDLRKPACRILLEQDNVKFGTQDVLEDIAKLSNALVRYKNTDLFLLLEKRGASNSGDLLSGESMRALVDWARQEYDFVVLDMPPMSIASDSESVADIADASMLVVRQNSARTSYINQAIGTLDRAKGKMLGCVLNDVYSTFLSSGQGYHYGSYGRYGHYGSYDEKTSRK